MKKLIGLAALAMLVTANAGMFGKEDWEKSDCVTNHSVAWCLMKSASLHPDKEFLLNDAEVENEQYRQMVSGSQAQASLGVYAFNKLSGIGMDGTFKASLGIGLLSGLLQSSPWDYKANSAYVLTQQDDTGTQEEFKRLYQSLEFTLSERFHIRDIKYMNSSEVRSKIPSFVGKYKNGMLYATGDVCGVGNVCRINFGSQSADAIYAVGKNGDRYGYRKKELIDTTVLGQSLNVGKETRVNVINFMPSSFDVYKAECVATGQNCELIKSIPMTDDDYATFSAGFGKSVWTYVGVNKEAGFDIPAVYVNGQRYLFVKPKSNNLQQVVSEAPSTPRP